MDSFDDMVMAEEEIDDDLDDLQCNEDFNADCNDDVNAEFNNENQ